MALRAQARDRRKACIDSPDAALAELQEEQRQIGEELEATFLAYDRKLQEMAGRLRASGGVMDKRELKRLRSEQTDLWRLVRRAQAAFRSTHELERELREWSHRPVGAMPSGHPDHPGTRIEIVGSELRVRGVGAIPLVDIATDDGDEKADISEDGPAWNAVPAASLLREIEMKEKEMARLLAQGSGAETSAEIAAFARELRELHAHLRRTDKQEGRSRDRLGMGVAGDYLSA